MRKHSIVLFSMLSLGGALGVAGSQGLKGFQIAADVNSPALRTPAVNTQAGAGGVKASGLLAFSQETVRPQNQPGGTDTNTGTGQTRAVRQKGKGGDKDLVKGKGSDDKGGKIGKGGDDKGKTNGDKGKSKGKGKQVPN